MKEQTTEASNVSRPREVVVEGSAKGFAQMIAVGGHVPDSMR